MRSIFTERVLGLLGCSLKLLVLLGLLATEGDRDDSPDSPDSPDFSGSKGGDTIIIGLLGYLGLCGLFGLLGLLGLLGRLYLNDRLALCLRILNFFCLPCDIPARRELLGLCGLFGLFGLIGLLGLLGLLILMPPMPRWPLWRGRMGLFIDIPALLRRCVLRSRTTSYRYIYIYNILLIWSGWMLHMYIRHISGLFKSYKGYFMSIYIPELGLMRRVSDGLLGLLGLFCRVERTVSALSLGSACT